MTHCPPTTIFPPDQWSPGVSSVICSISPVMFASVGAAWAGAAQRHATRSMITDERANRSKRPVCFIVLSSLEDNR